MDLDRTYRRQGVTNLRKGTIACKAADYYATAPDTGEHTIAQLTDMNMNELYSQTTHNGEP